MFWVIGLAIFGHSFGDMFAVFFLFVGIVDDGCSTYMFVFCWNIFGTDCFVSSA